MSRAFDRTLKSVKQQLLPRREPPPNFTGWKDTDVVMWRLENGETLQDLVREAQPAWEKHLKKMEAKRKRERDRRSDEGDARMEAMMASSEAKPAPKAELEARQPGQSKPETQWWEERARWRQRGPEDYDWEKPRPGMCLVEYDPLAWYDEED
jgi:hypothetical protein